MTDTVARIVDMDALEREVRNLTTEKGWREDEPGQGPREGHQFAAYLMLGVSEFSEALEAYRDKCWSETCSATSDWENIRHHPSCSGRPHKAPKPVGVGPELADTFIRILDMCDIWGIDLLAETRRVMDYGWTRAYRHGGRQL